MRKLLLILLITLLILPSYTPVRADDPALTDYVVSGEILHLREGPGLSYPIIETMKQGQALKGIKREGDWLHVQKGDVQGWVAAWLVKDAAKATQSPSNKTVIAQVDRLNLRAEPSLSAAVYTQLSLGAEAKFLQEQPDWIQVQYNNQIGWVAASYVAINDVQPSAEVAVNDPTTFTVTVDALNVRKKPDLTAKKIGLVRKNEQFKVLSRSNNWVEIKVSEKEKGWVYSFYGSFTTQATTAVKSTSSSENNVTIIYNNTNLREKATTSSAIVQHANAGQTFKIVGVENDWYQIEVDNTTAYVANWVVTTDNATTSKQKADRKKGTLKGVTIVLDPGHGGNDHGTTGVRGTAEKDITNLTAELLHAKLRAAGANVILTRESDVYVDLRKRVAISHQYAADAFISIHYDAIEDSSVSGFTTYYTNAYQQELAEYVHDGLADKVTIKDRGARAGDYLVLRENRQPAILLEFGYLSNANEERTVTTDHYREQATLGVYQGILNYFDAQLEQ